MHGALTPDKPAWKAQGFAMLGGNVMLMMYYTTVAGWLLYYMYSYVTGNIVLTVPGGTAAIFEQLVSSPQKSTLIMAITVAISALVCAVGLQKGVEAVSKIMMIALFMLIFGLSVKSLTLPGAKEALRFYLLPDWNNFFKDPAATVFAALGQAFFSLSIGIGSMAIFGSYINKKRTLTGECMLIVLLDTMVAFFSGLIIFPICFSYNIDVSGGPNLIFIALPHVFGEMHGGNLVGAVFFLFLLLAALTTVIAVLENLIAFLMDELRFKRSAAAATTGIAVILLSLPCVFGFNLWSKFQPLGKGSTILDLEDFIVSQNLLPLGAFVMVLFCTWKCGWGWNSFIEEANSGSGLKLPGKTKWYFRYCLPLIIIAILITGYKQIFF